MKYVVQLLFFMILLFPSIAHAQPQPPLIAKDGRFQPATGPYRTFINYNWSETNDRQPVKWKSLLPAESTIYINNSFYMWSVLPGAPDYLAGQEVSLLTGAGILFTDYDLCAPGAEACATATAYNIDNVRENYSVWTWQIDYPMWDDHIPAERQETITHELGHTFGLHDRMYSGGACDTSAPSTTMAPYTCSNYWSTPTQEDSDQLGRMHKYCDGTCGKAAYSYAYFSSGNLHARWKNKVWNEYVALFFYYRFIGGNWVLHSIDQHYDDVGFRYNGITYSGNQPDLITLISNAGNARNRFGQGSLVAICSIPATPRVTPGLFYYGEWDCTGGITIP